jgi:hypothetical protein
MLVSTWDENNYIHFFSITFNSFHQQINIVFIKDDIYILVDIVITDSTQVNLFFWFCATQGFGAFDAVQTKERSYHNWHPNSSF